MSLPRLARARIERITWLGVVFLVVHPAARGSTPPASTERFRVVRILISDDHARQRLLTLEEPNGRLEIWSHDLEAPSLDARVSVVGERMLREGGFQLEVLVDDLDRFYAENFAGVGTGDFFDDYQTYESYLAFMQNLVDRFPDLASLVDLGPSVEGRRLLAVHIGTPGEDKPEVMFHGGQHGNEIMGPPVIAFVAERLLASYGTDPYATRLVDGMNWYLLPIMNPDGYPSSRYNRHGTDLNRDWAGPGQRNTAFTQPETQAMRDFFLAHPRCRSHLDLHTYGQLILWPWCHTYGEAQDHYTYLAVGRRIADLIYEYRRSRYTPEQGSDLYPINGGSNNYSYGIRGAWAYTFELGYSHNMSKSEIRPTCMEMYPAVLYLVEWVLDCNGNQLPDSEDILSGASPDCNYNAVPDECESPSDCDVDEVTDLCEFVDRPDCNYNAVPDDCDLERGRSDDDNANGVPDECDSLCSRVIGFHWRCESNKIKGRIRASTTGNDWRITLDGRQWAWFIPRTGTVDHIRFRHVRPGPHTVRVDQCPFLHATLECN